ncbi:MAG: replicative DNA helicase [Alphaproteobacteria bacterium]|nr:replicative DNA helicase [Alphaproteobacteria bacterium]
MPGTIDTDKRSTLGLIGLSERAPPANIEAEQALLGAILANNKAYERISDFLSHEHFALAAHGKIFAAAARLIERGQLANAVTLKSWFENTGELEEVGGPPYLAQLVAAMVGIINAADYGRVIFDSYLRRQLIDVGEEVVNRAYGMEPQADARAQLEMAEQSLFDLATSGRAEGDFVSFETALARAADAAERAFRLEGHVSGITTGLRDLDAKLGGLQNSDLVILAGRPGMGKTALAMKIAFSAAKAAHEEAEAAAGEGEGRRRERKTVAVFSLEMSADQLATRLVAEQTRISSDRIRRGDIAQKDFDRFVLATQQLYQLPLFIDDTPALSISALRTRARRLKRKEGLGLIVVDYLQLLRPPLGERPENRVLEISAITQGLKALAKELAVPVLALSQLSRAVESREDKRPQLSDLRESGTIEQDADVVIFLYRDEYYLAGRKPKETQFPEPGKLEDAITKWQEQMDKVHNVAEIIIAKQRHGPTGTVEAYFEGEFTAFGNLDRHHADADMG